MHFPSERTNTHTQSRNTTRVEARGGAAHVAVITLLVLSLFSAGVYVYAVNRSAVQGYAMRTLEKELKEMKQANIELRVREAEAASLTRIEAGSAELRMERAETTTVINTRTNTVAIR